MRGIAAAGVLWMCACGGGDSAAVDGGAGGAVDAAGPAAVDAALTAGCGQASAMTGVFEGAATVASVERSYLVAVPDGYDPTRAYPLVFGFHGRGSNSAQARSYFGVEEAAGGAAIVVYPQGLGQNNVPTDTSWDISPASADLDLFDAIVEALAASHCIDRARIFATGHSAGGFMSNHLACHRGEALRGIAPVAGGGPLSSSCTGGAVPAMIVHGSVDTVVLPVNGERSRDYWRVANGCGDTTTAVDPAPCVAYDGCGADSLRWCLHDEAVFSGHGWPSFAAAGIWPFFAQL